MRRAIHLLAKIWGDVTSPSRTLEPGGRANAATFEGSLPWLRALVAAIGFSVALLPASVFALSAKDAATVVQLIETLQDELGNFAYDDEFADDWFERDAESQGLITAAGFSQESWRTAVGDTYRGFLANVPEAEILKVFADARRRVEATRSLSPEQKTIVLQVTDAKRQELLQLRTEGKAFARTVQPLVPRLRAISDSFSTQE